MSETNLLQHESPMHKLETNSSVLFQEDVGPVQEQRIEIAPETQITIEENGFVLFHEEEKVPDEKQPLKGDSNNVNCSLEQELPVRVSNANYHTFSTFKWITPLSEMKLTRSNVNMNQNIMVLPKKAQFNLFEAFSQFPPCPDVLQAYVCDYLQKEDLTKLKHISSGAKFFIEKKHRVLSVFRDPKHLGRLRTYDDLTPRQKLKLEFMKFNDRPVYQRGAIVIVCVVLSPLILVWHTVKNSPYLCELWIRSCVIPPLQVMRFILQKLLDHVVNPLFKFLIYMIDAICKTCAWILQQVAQQLCRLVITPTCNAMIWLANALNTYLLQPAAKILVSTGNFVANKVLSPCAEGFCWLLKKIAQYTQKLCVWFFETIVVPVVKGIEWVAQKILATLWFLIQKLCQALQWLFERVISPCCTKVIYPFLILPLAKALKWVFLGIFYYLPLGIARFVFKPLFQALCWIWNRAAFPALQWTYTVLEGICVGFATKIFVPLAQGLFNWVIMPMLRGIALLGDVVLNSVLKPAGHAIAAVAEGVVEYGIKPACRIVSVASQATYDYVLRPAGLFISSLSSFFGSLFGSK
jgi:hypothetical protein